MRLKVKFFAELRELYGKEHTFECECRTPKELKEFLFTTFPKLKEKEKEYGELGLVVLVNGRDIRHLNELPEGEVEVSLFPPAAGG